MEEILIELIDWIQWGCSSVGRASGSQSEGQGFDSPQLHQSNLPRPMIDIYIESSKSIEGNYGNCFCCFTTLFGLEVIYD